MRYFSEHDVMESGSGNDHIRYVASRCAHLKVGCEPGSWGYLGWKDIHLVL